MKMSITMTDAEVREAIKTWLDEHGVPSHKFTLDALTNEGTRLNYRDMTFRVIVETEAPHMEGPYR